MCEVNYRLQWEFYMSVDRNRLYFCLNISSVSLCSYVSITVIKDDNYVNNRFLFLSFTGRKTMNFFYLIKLYQIFYLIISDHKNGFDAYHAISVILL